MTQQRIGTLKSKIFNVNNLIAQTRQIIQPYLTQKQSKIDDKFQSIKVNNYTNAKVKIDIIIPPFEDYSLQLKQQDQIHHRHFQKTYNLKQEQHHKQNLQNQISVRKNERTAQNSNIEFKYAYQKQMKRCDGILKVKQRKEKSFKKINTSFLPEIKQVKNTKKKQEEIYLLNKQNQSTFSKKISGQTKNNQENENLEFYNKQNSILSQKYQRNLEQSLDDFSAIKILDEFKNQQNKTQEQNDQKLCQIKKNQKQLKSSQWQNNQKIHSQVNDLVSEAQSSIKQENVHDTKLYEESQFTHSYFQLSKSKFDRVEYQENNEYFQLTPQQNEQYLKIQNKNKNQKSSKGNIKSPQIVPYCKQNNIYSTPIMEQTINTKRMLFQDQSQKQQIENLNNQKINKQTTISLQQRFQTPFTQAKAKQSSLQDTQDSKVKYTYSNLKNLMIANKIENKNKSNPIVLSQSKRLKNYSQLEKYRRIRVKSQENRNNQTDRNRLKSKIVHINLQNQKAEDLFLKHKKNLIQKLKNNEKKNYGTYHNLNISLSQINNKQKFEKRSLSPKCQEVTNRLYNSKIGIYPCSFYEKFHQQTQRERFQEMVKQYPTVRKYLSQRQRAEFYIYLKKIGCCQTKWITKLLEYTNKKMKVCFKK